MAPGCGGARQPARRRTVAEWRKRYRVLEQETRLPDEIARHVPAEEAAAILGAANPAARALQMQGAGLKALLDAGAVTVPSYLEMLKVLRDLHDQQARAERIKNFPYPRQYAVVSALFVGIFCLLLPFGMIGLFEPLDAAVGGVLKGHLVWLVVPFSAVIGWMYCALDLVGESTAHPFEGGANDVPISQISVMSEIELKEMMGESELTVPLAPLNGIAT